MGDRGPRPKPSETLRRQGSWRGNRNKNEPVYELAIEAGKRGPFAPKWMGSFAKQAWKERVESLRDTRLVTTVDLHALERLCHAHGRWRSLAVELDRAEEWERATNATALKKHAAAGELPAKDSRTRIADARALAATQATRAKRLAQVYAKADEICTRLEREFGFTPSARSRVETAPAAPPKPEVDAPRGERGILDLFGNTGEGGA